MSAVEAPLGGHDGCPGCPGLALPSAELLERKRARVVDAFARFEALRAVALPSEVARREPVEGYRTRAKWVVDHGGKIGLYARGSHDVVEVDGCSTLPASIAQATGVVRGLVADARDRVEGALEALSPRVLRGLDLRELAHPPRGLLVTLTYARGAVPTDAALARVEARLAERLAQLSPPLALSLSSAELDASPRTLGTYRIDPSRARLDRIGEGPPFLAAHGSFVQAHRGVAAAIQDRIADAVRALSEDGRASEVLELYAGSASLGLRLAAEGARVTALERFAPAIELARASARRIGVDDRFRAISDDAKAFVATGARFDAIVVNPPRRGLASEVRDALLAMRPRLVAYVSCDPETLARDVAILARAGLAARAIEAFDMMPGTFEVESLAWLEPREPLPVRVLHEGVLASGARWIAVDKPPHEPTTPHPERPSSLLDRVRRRAGFEEASPAHRLDEGTSGVCLFGANAEATAALARALKEGEKRYVALVRGVPRLKGIVRTPLRDAGRLLEATTRYRRRAVIAGHGLLDVRPEQGRTHQIRLHLASLGHPVVGDTRYGHAPTNRHFEEKATLDRAFLHCARIQLELEGRPLVIEAELAEDLQLALDRARGSSAARPELA